MANEIVLTPAQHETVDHALAQAHAIIDIASGALDGASNQAQIVNALWAAENVIERTRETIGKF